MNYNSKYSQPATLPGVGPWHSKIFLHDPDHPKPSESPLLETEYFVELNHVLQLIHIIKTQAPEVKALISLVSLTTISKGSMLMSPSVNQRTFALSISWEGSASEVQMAIQKFEKNVIDLVKAVDFTKHFEFSKADLKTIYGGRLMVFNKMVETLDPEAKMNDHFFESVFEVGVSLEDL